MSSETDQIITDQRREYFASIAQQVHEPITAERQAWYIGKAKALGDDMMREYPSTPDEAFQVTIRGAYYAKEIREARVAGRITKVSYQPVAPVNTWWDLGINDKTAIWFMQRIGKEWHAIDYYENTDEGLAHYARVLQDKKYLYGTHIAPHDIRVRELGAANGEGARRIETAKSLGINFTIAPGPNEITVADGIQAVRDRKSVV